MTTNVGSKLLSFVVKYNFLVSGITYPETARHIHLGMPGRGLLAPLCRVSPPLNGIERPGLGPSIASPLCLGRRRNLLGEHLAPLLRLCLGSGGVGRSEVE